MSEFPHARAVARHCGTRHCELVVRPADIVDNLAAVIRARDVPASEAADVPLGLLAKRARADVKVVLSGEGADEIFGGHYKYLFEPFSAWYRAMPSGIHRAAERVLPRLPGRLSALARYGRAAGEADPKRPQPALVRVGTRCPRGGRPPLHGQPPSAAVGRGRVRLLGYTGARQASFVDVRCWLPDNLLERADRLTMAASLELRAPFLDHGWWRDRFPAR